MTEVDEVAVVGKDGGGFKSVFCAVGFEGDDGFFG